MAKAIYDALNSQIGTLTGSEDTGRKKICAAIASGVVSHIKANADVIVTTSNGGLQRDPSSGDPTDPPSSDQTLSGAVD